MTTANWDVIDQVAGQVVKHATGSPASHVVVVGGFGAGKTHALVVALQRAARMAPGNDLAVFWVPLGGTAVTSYADLLYEIAISQPAAADRARELRRAGQVKELERLALRELPGKRRLVVVVEHLEGLLAQLPGRDREALASMLSRRSRPLLLGSSQTALHAEVAHQFVQLSLQPLTDEEALSLLVARLRETPTGLLADVTDVHGQVASFNRLVGGSPRFWVLAAEFLAAGDNEALSRAFDAFLDLLDIRYSERLRGLAPSERRAVVELARAGRPQTVSELAERLGLTNQSVASTLGRLTESSWVRRVEPVSGSDRRLTWYDLAEPLLRHYVQPPDKDSSTDFVRGVQVHWHRQQTAVPPVETEIASLDGLEAKAAELGAAGFAAAARDLYRRVLVGRIETEGLASPQTLRTLTEYGVWTASAGATDKGRVILQAAVRSADAIAPDSEEAFEAYIHLAGSDISLRQYDRAIATLDQVIERAAAAGPPALGSLLHARQNRARAIGDRGDPAGAVREFEQVLADRLALRPDDDQWIRTNRHGLAWWTGEAGDPAAAVAMFEEMLDNPRANDWERLHYRLSAAHWAGRAVGAGEAARRYHEVAEDIARSRYADSYIARDARREALKWSLRAHPGEPGRLLVTGVHPDDFANLLSAELLNGRLSFDDAASLPLTRAQADALAIACVFTRSRATQGWRSAAAAALAPLVSPAGAPLLLDVGRALAGDSRAESGLPMPWRPILAELRAIDQADPTTGGPG